MPGRSGAARLASLLAVAAVAAVAAAAAPGATPLTTVHPKGLPLAIGLPSGWQATGLIAGSRFDAASANGSAHLDVTTARFPAAFTIFVSFEKTAVRQHYRAEDPKASVTSRLVSLPSGKALETTVFVTHGSPLAIYVFALLHNNVGYHFTYFTSQSQASSQRPDFERSARSIKFTK